MTIRILLFAQYRDWAGMEHFDVSLPTGADVRAAVAAVRDALPGLGALPERPAVALNSVLVPLEAALADGDELALLPPVAGG